MIIRTSWIPGDLNLAGLLTKTTIPANRKNGFVDIIFANRAAIIKTNGEGQEERVSRFWRHKTDDIKFRIILTIIDLRGLGKYDCDVPYLMVRYRPVR